MLFDESQLMTVKGMQTPFYYYDMNLLEATLKAASEASQKRDFHVHYAVKANFNDRVLQKIQSHGFGADCVSGNEILKSLEQGFPANKITFAGVGKSDKEIQIALEHDIFTFNVESVQELEVINELAALQGKVGNVALRINPNIDAKTHKYITTGLDENKFGIPAKDLSRAIEVLETAENLNFVGLHFHIGSQITDLNVFKNLCLKVNQWKNWFEEKGLSIKVLNVGGGLGVDYNFPDENPIVDFERYFEIFDQFLERRENQEVHFELGRALVAQSGNLVSKTLYTKSGAQKNFLILDVGMTELLRPALYQAYHKIEKLEKNPVESERIKYDIVGPICESSDAFGRNVELPEVKRGDLLVIRSVGAYGEVMASTYNLREEIRYVYSDEI
ncbi:MAG TPA: diaminopimelate decarboxylase [Sphingobacterium sp.]|nr:diaminopimelate decarboxylase [Sphingobacterium sp.]